MRLAVAKQMLLVHCVCREERIEKAGPLGNADAVNQELDQVEGELLAAEAQGLGDAFTLYLRALIQMDR